MIKKKAEPMHGKRIDVTDVVIDRPFYLRCCGYDSLQLLQSEKYCEAFGLYLLEAKRRSMEAKHGNEQINIKIVALNPSPKIRIEIC